MKPYIAVLGARFRILLQYRAAAIAGMGTQLFWGLIRVMIFEAFYRSGAGEQPMALPDVITYVWLGQALIALQPWGVEQDLRALIRSGNVAYEMLRPLDLYTFWYSRAVAQRTAPTILRCIPLLAISGLFLGLQPPVSWPAAGAWLVTTLGALVLSCAITSLLTISLLWTVSGEGVANLIGPAVILLSGMIIPLPLFPDWAQPVLNFLPFRGLLDVPFRLYMGHLPTNTLLPLLAHQFAWSAAFILLGRVALHRGLRRLVVQGG